MSKSGGRKPEGRTIVVHNLDNARAALAAAAALDMPVILASPNGFAAYGGAAYFAEMIAQARAGHPQVAVTAILDCGDDAGYALAALSQGISAVRYRGAEATAARIADIAAQLGGERRRETGPALDLLDVADPYAACLDWLRANTS